MIGSAGGEGEGLGRHEEGGARAPGQRLHAPVLVDLLHPLELNLLVGNQSINQSSNQPRRDHVENCFIAPHNNITHKKIENK